MWCFRWKVFSNEICNTIYKEHPDSSCRCPLSAPLSFYRFTLDFIGDMNRYDGFYMWKGMDPLYSLIKQLPL